MTEPSAPPGVAPASVVIDPLAVSALRTLTLVTSLLGMGVIEFDVRFKDAKGEPVTLSGRIDGRAWSRDLRWAFAALAMACGTAAFCAWCFWASR